MMSHRIPTFILCTVATAAFSQQQPQTGQWEIVPAKSNTIQRGDQEILTFETAETLDRLEDLYRRSQSSKPDAATLSAQYFRSPMDGSIQPYGLWLPKDFDTYKAYPLVVQLHGLNFRKVLAGLRTEYRGMGTLQWIDPNQPVIIAQCFGRQSTFYSGMGEQDILATIAEVSRRFKVMEDHIYIMGHSMGGAGSYTIGLHHPDRFGGITPIDAAMGRNIAPPGDIPAWMKPQIVMYNPYLLYPNARNVDVFMKNAGAGIQRASTEFTDGIVAAGGFSTSESFPNMPHNFGQQYPYAMFESQLIAHPMKRDPAEVKFFTNTLQYNQAYWVTIDRLTRHGEESLVTAKKETSVDVTTKNIDAFSLRLGPDAGGVKIDGQDVANPASGHFEKREANWRAVEKAAVAGKRHGMQGPIGDAFNSRFLAVYGDGDRDLAIAELDALRNPPGRMIIHGDFPMKAAAKVNSGDAAESNLILFGTPATNPVLKRIASRLPAELLNGNSVFIYPNPENPRRYVVVWSAKVLSSYSSLLRAGYAMPINLLPDYVEAKDGKIIGGGHFDNDWKK